MNYEYEKGISKAVAGWLCNPNRASITVPEHVQLAIVERGYGAHLSDMENVAESAQIAAVRCSFEHYYTLKNPSEHVQMIALTHGQRSGAINVSRLCYWEVNHAFQDSYTPFSSDVLNKLKPGLAQIFAATEFLRNDVKHRDVILSRFLHDFNIDTVAPPAVVAPVPNQTNTFSTTSLVSMRSKFILQEA